MLNPYPEPQLKGYVPSHNSRNTSKPTFEISPKPCRPHPSKASKTQAIPMHYRLTLLLIHQAKFASRPPGGGHVLLGATRLEAHWRCRHRLAGPHSLSGATRSSSHYECSYHLAIQPCRQALHQYNEWYWLVTVLYNFQQTSSTSTLTQNS